VPQSSLSEHRERTCPTVFPEIAKDRDATVKAMKEVEQGWRKAMDTIAERASLTKGPNTRRYSK
jgi:hypothetical protein